MKVNPHSLSPIQNNNSFICTGHLLGGVPEKASSFYASLFRSSGGGPDPFMVLWVPTICCSVHGLAHSGTDLEKVVNFS